MNQVQHISQSRVRLPRLEALLQHIVTENHCTNDLFKNKRECTRKVLFSYLMHHKSLAQPEVLFHMWNYVARSSLKHFNN